jgi:probable F420-dependent oxidoreductase
MKFGLSIPTLTGFPRAQEPADGGWRIRWDRSFEICEAAERLGYDFGTVGHHRFTMDRVDSPQPMIAIAALAARTSTLKFCTNILVLPLHHPLDIAEQVAMVDEISDGRVMLGVAIGYRPYEFQGAGLDYKQRTSRLEEAVSIIRAAWGPDPIQHEGKHFTVDGANVSPKPVQAGGPPIWIGAQVDAAISRAARIGDGWLTDNMEAAARLKPKIAAYREESRAVGKEGKVILNRKIGIGTDRDRLEREWLPPILDVYRDYLRLGIPFDETFAEKLSSGKTLGIKDLPKGQIIVGTPDECAEAIQYCIDETGCDAIITDFGRGAHGPQYEEARAQMELFGREVMPRFT